MSWIVIALVSAGARSGRREIAQRPGAPAAHGTPDEMPPDIIETTPGQLNISDVAGSSSLGFEQPRRPASAATHDALLRIPNLVRGRSMTTAPNDGVCVLAADQPQSLSVIGGPGHRVRYRRLRAGRFRSPPAQRATHMCQFCLLPPVWPPGRRP